MTDTTTDTPTRYDCTVFQPRHFDREADPERAERAADIRWGDAAADDIDLATFATHYDAVGTDVVAADTPRHAATRIWPRWNNGSGGESEAFIAANEAERAVSMSTGDLVALRDRDGYEHVYLCESFGWQKVERLSGPTATA